MKRENLGYFGAVRFLSKYIGHFKRNFVMFYFGWLFDMMLGVVMPILFGIMIDEMVYHQNLDVFLRISLVFVLMSLFSCVLYFLIYAQHQYLMSMYVYDIQRDLFRHLQVCDAEHMANMKTGDLITIIQYYARECMHFVIRNIIHLTNGGLNLAILSIYLFIISPWIGLLMLVAVPISVLVNARYGKQIRAFSNEQREEYAGFVSYLYEVLTSIKDIRLLGATQIVYRNFVNRQRKAFAVGVKSGVSSITAQQIIGATNLSVQLAIFSLAAFLVEKGEMTIGLLMVILAYFSALTKQVSQISSSYLDAQNRVGYIQRIHDFLRTPTEDTWPGQAELRVRDGGIVAQAVEFGYQMGGDVLRGLDLNIHPGERIALCGQSGCGKTTFGYMLLGFHKARRGTISIDGQDLSDCNLRSLRRHIGMVSQDVLLFDGSIRMNLLLGKPNATEEELVDVLQQAGILARVLAFPDGLDTVIGSDGIALSGGERQRLAIARIYLKNPEIIIFDEATSSLDSDTEQHIHEAWEAVLSGRTSVVIAHRQSSVMMCDRAAILEDGRIVEIGAPSELAQSSAIFRKLFALEVTGDA